jgi:hypothetical protein
MSEETTQEIVEKNQIPNFFPTFKIKRNLYPVPIIVSVVCSGILAYLTYVEAGVKIDGGYISETEFGAIAGLINGIIFTVVAAISSFIIIFLVKKKGVNVLKYIFGISFSFLGFFLSLFFGEILLYLIFSTFPATETLFIIYYSFYYIMLISIGAYTFLMIYKFFKSESSFTKNFVVLYIGLLTGALMGIIMPLWTTLAILIGISLWDIFAVLYKRGPIKEMIDLVAIKDDQESISEDELKEKIKSGEISYDTSKLEIGIGDLAFYSMLTSSALILSNNLIVMAITSVAVIVGTGITILGLKHNKILPGLPISIFLGITAMLISWPVLSTFF